MKKHYFEVGQEVFFVDGMGLNAFGEIVATHGPWLWIDDGGGLHTVICDNAYYESSELPPEREKLCF